MIRFALDPGRTAPLSILCLGAHSDDLEIGCGATLLRLKREMRDLRVHWVVFAAGGERAEEARRGAGRVLEGLAHAEVELHDHRDGYFPECWGTIKDRFEALKSVVSPDVIFTHWGNDAHQDHRIISELTWNTWRDHLVLEYEVPKYDGDLGRPNLFVPIDAEIANEKVALLHECFASQTKRAWFSEETFLGLMRVRAVEAQCADRYAEAFHLRKALL